MQPSNDASQVGTRTRTAIKAGVALLTALCAALLVLSAAAMLQDEADRVH